MMITNVTQFAHAVARVFPGVDPAKLFAASMTSLHGEPGWFTEMWVPGKDHVVIVKCLATSREAPASWCLDSEDWHPSLEAAKADEDIKIKRLLTKLRTRQLVYKQLTVKGCG